MYNESDTPCTGNDVYLCQCAHWRTDLDKKQSAGAGVIE